MTKKKAIKKKTTDKVELKNECIACKYFSINGEGATRGRCHRYPLAISTTITHYCGEYE